MAQDSQDRDGLPAQGAQAVAQALRQAGLSDDEMTDLFDEPPISDPDDASTSTVAADIADIAPEPINHAERTEDVTRGGQSCVKWCFENARGQHVYSVRRTDRQPDGKKYPPWRDPTGMEGPWKPLYHKHLDSARGVVYVLEGETCADAAWQVGHQATCWLGGTSGTGGADWSPMAGMHAICIPDNDDVGRKAMAKVEDALRNVGCQVAHYDSSNCPDISQINKKGADIADLSLSVRKRLLDTLAEHEFEFPDAPDLTKPDAYANGAKAHRAATVDELDRQLRRIANHDVQHDVWRDVVTAAMAECGEAGYRVAKDWSAKSKKHDAQAFDKLWRATQHAADGAAWQRLVALAGGFNAMEGGAPRTADASGGTLRKRAERAVERIAETMPAIAKQMRVAPAEQADADRVLALCAERLLRVVGDGGHERVMVLGAGGMWAELEHRRSDATTGATAVTVRIARERAVAQARDAGVDDAALDDIVAYWHQGSTAQEKGSLARQVAQRVAGREVAVREAHSDALDDRSVRPVIPLAGGDGAWDIAAGERIDPAETATLLQTEMGWAMPYPHDVADDPATECMDAALEGRFAGLAERTAALLCGTAKTVDIFVCSKSSYGKTTYYDLARRAFPGMVERIDARTAYHTASMRFTPAALALTTRLLVVLDECGHVAGGDEDARLPTAAINSHTDEYMTIEKKGENVHTAKRTGSLVLVGHDWPPIDVHDQGIDTRIQWVHHVKEDADAMTQEERDMLVSPAAVQRFRFRLLNMAQSLMADPRGAFKASETDESKAARALFLKERIDPRVAALQKELAVDPSGFTSNADVAEVLSPWQGDNGKGISSKIVTVLLAKAFDGKAKRGRPEVNGERVRGWFGIKPAPF